MMSVFVSNMSNICVCLMSVLISIIIYSLYTLHSLHLYPFNSDVCTKTTPTHPNQIIFTVGALF